MKVWWEDEGQYNGSPGVEVYEHDIFYYADEYITNTLNIIPGDDNYKEIVRDNFNDMLFYIKII